MATTDIFLTYPNVTQILWKPESGVTSQVVLSAVSHTSRSRSQTPSGFAVDRQLFKTQGVFKNPDTINIVGIVCEDPVWGAMLQLGKYALGDFPSVISDVITSLDTLFDDQTLVKVWDNDLGTNEDYLITSLDYSPSLEFESTMEFTIGLTKQEFIKSTGINGEVKIGDTIDPYTFYEYDTLGKLK